MQVDCTVVMFSKVRCTSLILFPADWINIYDTIELCLTHLYEYLYEYFNRTIVRPLYVH